MTNAAEYYSEIPGVQMEDPATFRNYQFRQDLGFFVEELGNTLSFLGVCVPKQEKPHEFPAVVRPRTGYRPLPPSEQEFGKINRGVGPRLYDIPALLHGTKENYAEAGIYTVDIAANKLLDMRRSSPDLQSTRVKQAAKYITNKVCGGEALTNTLNKFVYRDNEALLYPQTPDSASLMTKREVTIPAEIEPAFLVIRSAEALMHRVGTYERAE